MTGLAWKTFPADMALSIIKSAETVVISNPKSTDTFNC